MLVSVLVAMAIGELSCVGGGCNWLRTVVQWCESSHSTKLSRTPQPLKRHIPHEQHRSLDYYIQLNLPTHYKGVYATPLAVLLCSTHVEPARSIIIPSFTMLQCRYATHQLACQRDVSEGTTSYLACDWAK